MAGLSVGAPDALGEHHDLSTFDSGVLALDDWLRRRARANQESGASRTFVVSSAKDVVAYYALASGAVALAEASGGLRRNMPDPVPMVVLGRLAVDRQAQGQGLGRALFADAARRVLAASQSIGIRGLLVHAISEEARAFYLALGLQPSPFNRMTLMIPVIGLRAILG